MKTVNILIGTTRILDLVLKHDGESECYGVTNDSYSPTNELLKNPEWLLGAGVHTIRVRFQCATVDQTFELTFRNPKNGPLEVTNELISDQVGYHGVVSIHRGNIDHLYILQTQTGGTGMHRASTLPP